MQISLLLSIPFFRSPCKEGRLAGGCVLGGGSQVPHTLLKTYECIITLTKTICSTTLSEDSSWCASEPLGLGSSVLLWSISSAPDRAHTTQLPLLLLQDKSGLLCQINHNCHFIQADHSAKLKPFCPYAFQIFINYLPYTHCLLWQLRAGNEWSCSLNFSRHGSAWTLGGSCLIIPCVLFLNCDCTSQCVCTPSSPT